MADAGGKIQDSNSPSLGDDGVVESFESSRDAKVDDALGAARGGVDGVVGKEVDANRRDETRSRFHDQKLEKKAQRMRRGDCGRKN